MQSGREPKFTKDATLTSHDVQMRDIDLRRRRKRKRQLLSLFPSPTYHWPEPERRFAILAQGRSGSTLLRDLLNSHNMIDCDGELFLHWHRFPERSLVKRMRAAASDVYGFKLLTYQPEEVLGFDSPQPLLDWLDRNNFRFIYLRRDNVLRHALSQLNARVNQFSQRGKSADERRPLHVEREPLFSWMRQLRHRRTQDEALMEHHRFLDVRYERDLEDSQQWQLLFERICEFLVIEPQAPKTELRKVNPRRIEDIVDNFDEMRDMLEGTEFEHFLD